MQNLQPGTSLATCRPQDTPPWPRTPGSHVVQLFPFTPYFGARTQYTSVVESVFSALAPLAEIMKMGGLSHIQACCVALTKPLLFECPRTEFVPHRPFLAEGASSLNMCVAGVLCKKRRAAVAHCALSFVRSQTPCSVKRQMNVQKKASENVERTRGVKNLKYNSAGPTRNPVEDERRDKSQTET